MLERLKNIEKRYLEIESLMASFEVVNDIKQTMILSKERSLLKDAYDIYQEYKQMLADRKAAKEMSHDALFLEFSREELAKLDILKQDLEAKIAIILLPKDPNDDKNVLVEIRGAAGGDEANIFAGDLFRMYAKYAEKEGYQVEVLNALESDAGGFSQISFMIKGDNVYGKLKYESGAHRVQRVPATETQGRVHTSTATVLVMPEVLDSEAEEINPNDIRIDVYRSSGKGGQGVNTTDSAVRITHMKTGIVVTCQNERSQIQNKEHCMKILKTKLYEEKLRKQEEKLGAARRNKLGTGDRSEKIRTYNYPQNRVTDHQISFTLKQLDR
ncbi:MAG: peptide chain release factor 1, partial [Bacilli bacterium]